MTRPPDPSTPAAPTRGADRPDGQDRPDPPADVFLRTVLRTGLVDRPRLTAVLGGLPPSARSSARQVIDLLIASGDLSHYQAEKILSGRWRGLVLGPYHILAPLGKGGMGTVYLARVARGAEGEKGRQGEQTEGGSVPSSPCPDVVALKVLSPRRAREEERMLLRFRREMELGKHLEHPNVTRTFDTGEVGGVNYIAMEYVPGQSLRQILAAGGPLAVPDAARIFAAVAAGLQHAHEKGLVHRDLKPANIMVTPEGQAKILDLGLALLLGETLPDDPSIVGGQGYILGTMDYIAPEQTMNATDVGPWSDVYALGCSLYHALTGVPPFPGGTSKQKRHWHRTETPPPIDALNPAVPAEFARLVEQLMAKQPADRPASAGAVRELLLPWAGASAPAVGPATLPHTAQEAMAEIDTRSFDPSLWDAVPAVEASAPEELPFAEEEDDVGSYWGWGSVLLAAGLAGGLGVLVLLFALLRRL
jgi:serine/threonine protein kinase